MVKQSSSHEPPQRPRYTNHQQSEIVEMFVAQELIGQGWNVAYPRSSHSIFDLIAVQGSRALRIQVNWVRSIIVIDGVVSVNQGLFLIHPLEKLILGINH